VSQLVGQGEGLMGFLEGAVWIAKMQQSRRLVGEAVHTEVSHIEESERVMLGSIVEGNPLLQMCSGGGQLSEPEQDYALHSVGEQEGNRSLNSLGQMPDLLCELTRYLELPPYTIKRSEPPQHRKELRSFSYLPAQIPRPSVSVFHFWGCVAFGSDQLTA